MDSLGLSSYPPAYLSEEAQSNNKSLLHGANFASGAAGYLDATAALYVRAASCICIMCMHRRALDELNRCLLACMHCRAPSR